MRAVVPLQFQRSPKLRPLLISQKGGALPPAPPSRSMAPEHMGSSSVNTSAAPPQLLVRRTHTRFQEGATIFGRAANMLRVEF